EMCIRDRMNSLVMRRALEYAKCLDVPIISHAEDEHLSDSGLVNEGIVSAMLGLKGIPRASEEIMIARDIALARLTGGRLHIAHVSTKWSVELIRKAKMEGINVSAETCPHYFTLTENEALGYNTMAKVNPPLRTDEDIEAIKEGIRDGTIDVIATDHAPHHRDEKLLEFDKAPFGISGLDTALSLCLNLVRDGIIDYKGLAERLSLKPASIIKIKGGSITVGSDANLTIFDPNKKYTLTADCMYSKGKNTPIIGRELIGKVIYTIFKDRVYHESA
ncbi:MAG: dihydroorotase, partial [Thermodesulfovibrionales bacterium]|nr:dihydroorotase [Thermodesulfovibrionales bacterium]